MRTSTSTRVRKLAAVGSAGFLILAMSGVAAVAEETVPGGGDATAGEPGGETGEGGETGGEPGGGTVQPGEGDGGEAGGGTEEPGDGGEGGHEGGGGGGGHGGGGHGGGHANPPEPLVVETVINEEAVCGTLDMAYQLQTVTTAYVWKKGQWVLAPESTTEVVDMTRDLTADEIAALCPTEEPPADDGDVEDGDTDTDEGGVVDTDDGDTDEVAGVDTAVPAAAPAAEVLGVEAALPTEVDAGLGAPVPGSPLGSGLMGAGAALLALAGGLALGRRVGGEHVR